MGLESKNTPEQTSDLLAQLKQNILSSQEILRQDPPFVIPSTLQLSLGQLEKLCYESPARAHKIVKKDATTYEYTMKGVIPVGQHNEFVEACMANVNALLSDPNYVIDVSINEPNPEKNDPGGLGVGIGGAIARTEHKGEYIGRLTVTLVVGTKTSGKQRVTSVDAQGVYFVSDPINNPNADVSAQYEKQKSTLTGYTQVKPKNVSVGDQNALFALQYKLNKAAAAATPNQQPVVTNQPIGTYETLQGKLVIGKQVDRFSHEGAVCLPLLLNGVQVGSLVKCEAKSGRKAQADFISAKANSQCFDTDTNGHQFPSPSKIVSYLGRKHPGKTIKVGMITTGPCFQSYQDPTVTGVAIDGGLQVGHETAFVPGNSSSGKGVAYMIGGQMTIKHSGEPGFQIPSSATDVVTMSSLARIDRSNPSSPQYLINPNASLRRHDNAHAMVSFADGKRGELIINGCTSEQKQAVVSALMKNTGSYQIERALYADADAPTNFLDGIFVFDTKTNGLRYSHPNSGDLFRTPEAQSGDVVKNHMPGVMVYYAVQN